MNICESASYERDDYNVTHVVISLPLCCTGHWHHPGPQGVASTFAVALTCKYKCA